MRHTMFILLIIAMAPLTTRAGAIARQFASGYEGVSWGASLAELVELRPGGDHFFALGGGVRDYGLSDEVSMFGIPRSQMRVRYFLDDTNSVVSAGLTFPYEERQKLLGTLILSFGPHQHMSVKGISTYYTWPRDDGIGITLRATLDPSFGILEVSISGPNSELLKKVQSDCTRQAPSPKPKK